MYTIHGLINGVTEIFHTKGMTFPLSVPHTILVMSQYQHCRPTFASGFRNIDQICTSDTLVYLAIQEFESKRLSVYFRGIESADRYQNGNLHYP